MGCCWNGAYILHIVNRGVHVWALQFTAQFSLHEEVKYFVCTLSHRVRATEFGRQESSVQDERSGAQVIFPSPLPLFPAHFPSPLKTCFHFLCHVDKLFFKFLNRLLSPFRSHFPSALRTHVAPISHIQFKTLNLWTIALSLSSYQIFNVTYLVGSIFLFCKVEPQIFFLVTSIHICLSMRKSHFLLR